MEAVAEVNKIIQASIKFAQNTQDEEQLTSLLHLTREFMFILDSDKSGQYKTALLEEYLEDIAEVVPNTKKPELIAYIKNLPASEQLELTNAVREVIPKFFDPLEINPHLVTFWLDRTCDMLEIKTMAALMLLLEPPQQQKILMYDKSFKNDPKWQQLFSCLPKD